MGNKKGSEHSNNVEPKKYYAGQSGKAVKEVLIKEGSEIVEKQG